MRVLFRWIFEFRRGGWGEGAERTALWSNPWMMMMIYFCFKHRPITESERMLSLARFGPAAFQPYPLTITYMELHMHTNIDISELM
jgi:hypothetical protein